MEKLTGTQREVKYVDGKFQMMISGESIPQPQKGEVQVRVHYSTINPYDRIMYNVNKDENFVLGCDGCGIITAVGEGVESSWIGKKVAFLGNGWSNYVCKPIEFIVPFDNDFNLKHGANTYVNPFTVTAMLDYAQKLKAKAVVLMAASSALSKMMIRLCQKNGIETVNIVRKDDQVHDLKENFGAKFVLNSEQPTFESELQKVIGEVAPTVLFECVGGDLAGEIFKHMPHKSHMVVYGNLSKKKVSFEPQEFHWADKVITGLMMFRWVSSLDLEERRRWFKVVTDDLHKEGGKIFGSHIVKEVPLESWESALGESEKEASQGKYLVKCITE